MHSKKGFIVKKISDQQSVFFIAERKIWLASSTAVNFNDI
jgi:hypothetical protein